MYALADWKMMLRAHKPNNIKIKFQHRKTHVPDKFKYHKRDLGVETEI